MEAKKPKEESGIKVNDLLVGEHTAMQMASEAWALLYKIQQGYLTSLIARIERDDKSRRAVISLPMLKLILFFAEYLKKHVDENTELKKALADAQENAERQMFMDGVM